MARHGIPTADYKTFTDPEQAKAHIAAQGAPIVVKADGLAAGKGVVVAATRQEACDAVDRMLDHTAHGNKDEARVVVEACLHGEEISFIVMCDRHTILPPDTSQDPKRHTH